MAAPQITESTLRTHRVDIASLVHLDPQQVFDLLPVDTRDAIDLGHFKDVLTTIHLMFVELQRREVSNHALSQEELIARVERDLS